MSLKPFELALHHGHGACAEYLLTYEALGDLAVDFTSLEAEAGRLQHENADYKNNFRSARANVCMGYGTTRVDTVKEINEKCSRMWIFRKILHNKMSRVGVSRM